MSAIERLWCVEYNWRNGTIHREQLEIRAIKNAYQIIVEGRPRDPDLVLVGVMPKESIDKWVKDFLKAAKTRKWRRSEE